MKNFVLTLFFVFATIGYANAQSDTIVFKLKNGNFEKYSVSQMKLIRFENVMAVDQPKSLLSNVSFLNNFPNPITNQTNIEFELCRTGKVEILIFDGLGNIIKSILCENCQLGKNSIQWDGLDDSQKEISSGTYYCRLRFENELLVQKMVVIKK